MGQSELLYELYQLGLKQQEVAPCLYSGRGQLMAWHHEPISPQQTEAWIADMRKKLRPNQFARMIKNEFTVAEIILHHRRLVRSLCRPQPRPHGH